MLQPPTTIMPKSYTISIAGDVFPRKYFYFKNPSLLMQAVLPGTAMLSAASVLDQF